MSRRYLGRVSEGIDEVERLTEKDLAMLPL